MIFNIINQENLVKNQEVESLFIRLLAFTYLNSYDSKEKKTTFLELIIRLIKMELEKCDLIDDLFSKNSLIQKILFSFFLQPQILRYSTKHIRFAFFKDLQELDYSDLNKITERKNVEKILNDIFVTFINTLNKIPFLIRFFCFASLKLCEAKVYNIHL